MDNNTLQIVEDVKSITYFVINYQMQKGYDTYDYGYDLRLNVWEASFFDANDIMVERFVAHTKEELVNQLIVK